MQTITYNFVVRSANSRRYWEKLREFAIEHGITGRIILFQDHRISIADLRQDTLEGVTWKAYSEAPKLVNEFEAGIDGTEEPRWVFAPTKQYPRIRNTVPSIELAKGSKTYGISVTGYDGSLKPLSEKAVARQAKTHQAQTNNGHGPTSVEYTLVVNEVPASNVSYAKSVERVTEIPGIFGLGIIFYREGLSIVDPRKRATYTHPRRWRYEEIADVLEVYEKMLLERSTNLTRWMLVPRGSLGKVQNRLRKPDVASRIGLDSVTVSTYDPSQGTNGARKKYQKAPKLGPLAQLLVEAETKTRT